MPLDTPPLILDCRPINIADLVAVARKGRQVLLGPRAQAAMERSRHVVDEVTSRGEVVYGITTGFGKFADRVIPPDSLELLQRNLLLSHSVGVGPPLPDDVTRSMMALR